MTKTPGSRSAIAVAAMMSGAMLSSQALAVVKADNTTSLNLGASWVGGSVPTSAQLFEINNTLTASRSAAVGGNVSVLGIDQATNTGFQLQVNNTASSTLTVGASGIAVKSTTANANLILACQVALSANQTWSIGTGRSLQLNSPTFSDGGNTLQVNGPGTFDLRPSGAYTLGSNVTIDAPVSINSATAIVTLGGANTNNTLNVPNGVVKGATIGDFGVASNLGDGGTNTAISLGGSGSAGTLEYTGNNGSTNRTIVRDNRFTTTASGIVNVTTSGQTLTVSGNLGYAQPGTANGNWEFGGAGNLTLTGIISDPGLTAAPQSGVIKKGAGTLRLANANTYEDTTQVTEGTLLVTNSIGSAGSGTGLGAVTVSSGATLGGTGRIAGDTTVAGTLAPGANGVGLLTFFDSTAAASDVTLNGAATLEIASVGPTKGTNFDNISVEGLLTYGGTLSVPVAATVTSNISFDLFDFGTRTGTFSSITLSGNNVAVLNSGNSYTAPDAGGNVWSFDYATGTLLVTVPEPTSLGLLSLGALTLLRRSRKA